jgi:putative Holliday junction resolvase
VSRRILALDPGSKRIGLALSDDLGWLASPLEVRVKQGLAADLAYLREIVETHEVGEVVVGVPYRLGGGESASTERARAFLEAVRGAMPTGVVVTERDEALTTWAAEERMKAAGLGPEARKKQVDAYAAAVLLEEVLAERAPRPSLADEE